MKKTLVASYSYKNKASARIYFRLPKSKREFADVLEVHLKPFDTEGLAWAMRIDEAVLFIQLLAKAINRTAMVWSIGLDKNKKRY